MVSTYLVAGYSLCGVALGGAALDGADTSGNAVVANFIGLDATGGDTLGGGQVGVLVFDGARDNLVAGNVISGNASGIRLHGPGTTGKRSKQGNHGSFHGSIRS